MYKYLKHNDKKYPIRVSNTVIGEWQEATGKTDMKKLNFKDLTILITQGLKAGHRFAEEKYKLTSLDIEMMVDTRETVTNFLKLIPEFFPPQEEVKEEEELGNVKLPKPKAT